MYPHLRTKNQVTSNLTLPIKSAKQAFQNCKEDNTLKCEIIAEQWQK